MTRDSQTVFVAPIVEGHGEVAAIPVLLRRIAQASPLEINPPLRVKSGSFLKDEEYFKKYFELAAQKTKQWSKGCVLIVLDCDDACPATLGSELYARAKRCHSDVNTIVILAYREYETWFLASARSLRGVCGLPVDLEPPENSESIRNAKGWLQTKMGKSYNEPDHQPRMTALFSFEEAARLHSFARALGKFKKLFEDA